MTNNDFDNLLRTALYAGAEATDRIHSGDGQHMRRLADELYGQNHVLLTPATCTLSHFEGRQCPVCDGGLAVCANCNEFEAGLNNPCKPLQTMTGIHDSTTCTLGPNGGPCAQCVEAAEWERHNSERGGHGIQTNDIGPLP